MKKLIPLFIIISLMLCSFSVSAEETPNLVNAINSDFESATTVQDTEWYKLVDAFGSTTTLTGIYNNISIKNDGGHDGNNYISMSSTKAWYSPSINIYPYISEAGEDSYVISFWYRANNSLTLKHFCIRGLQSDSYSDGGEFQPDIVNKGNGNYYAVINGSSTKADLNGWKFFVSNPIEVVGEQFDGNHNWWFCLDQLPASTDAPLVFDIDGFNICSELDFEMPEELIEKDIVTDITYLTEEITSNAIIPSDESAQPETEATPTAAPVLSPTATPDAQNKNNGSDYTLPIIIGASVFVISAVATVVVLKVAKKKK